MKQLDYILNNQKEVLTFLKSQYPLYHLSNIFFRDMQYGIRTMFERKGEKVSYSDGEKMAQAFVEKMEKEKIFNRIDRQTWALNYPEYKKPVVMPAAPAKPAPGAAPVKSSAAAPGTARPALPPLGGAKPVGAKPALPPLGSAKLVDGAKSSLPPLSGAKLVGTAKPSLPPLTSAKPAGGVKPTLPPLTNAKPAGGSAVTVPAKSEQETQVVAESKPETTQPAAIEKKEVPQPAMQSATPTGAKKGLPPLKGNYTPAGKK